MSLVQIKHFWDYMGSKVIVRGKSNKEIFEFMSRKKIEKILGSSRCTKTRDYTIHTV